MTRVGFIVEGEHEQDIVRRVCPGAKVVRLGANGESTSMEAIAKKIDALNVAFGNRYFPIVVLFDREKRDKSCEKLRSELISEMKKRRIPIDQFIISISDRKIENWILPFVDKEGALVEIPCESADGKAAESELIRRLRRAGVEYHKRTNGVELFCRINPNNLANISPSFRWLYDSLKQKCPWMRNLDAIGVGDTN